MRWAANRRKYKIHLFDQTVGNTLWMWMWMVNVNVCLRSFKIKLEIGLMQDRALGEQTQRRTPPRWTGPDPHKCAQLHIQVSRKSDDHFSQRYEPNCGKRPYLAVLKNPFKNNIPRSGSRSGWFPNFNQFPVVHSYISGKIFMKIPSIVFTWDC